MRLILLIAFLFTAGTTSAENRCHSVNSKPIGEHSSFHTIERTLGYRVAWPRLHFTSESSSGFRPIRDVCITADDLYKSKARECAQWRGRRKIRHCVRYRTYPIYQVPPRQPASRHFQVNIVTDDGERTLCFTKEFSIPDCE